MVKAEKAQEVTMDPAALELLALAEEKQMDTLWDRQEKMEPKCGYGELGLCCRICLQGPCRINPFGDEPKKGICGARDYTIVA
ncbi:MAG: carbon monoxide dehydrogenase, partial [Thermoplasmata archaeon]|nr:carbon monoxide dehydrogenase [Thermoplasmata archaeon]